MGNVLLWLLAVAVLYLFVCEMADGTIRSQYVLRRATLRERRLLLRTKKWCKKYFEWWANPNWMELDESIIDEIDRKMNQGLEACDAAGIPLRTIELLSGGLKPARYYREDPQPF